MGKEKRFITVFEENISLATAAKILIDTQTGVHYLMTAWGNSGGITPLLDEHGAPVIGFGGMREEDAPWNYDNQ